MPLQFPFSFVKKPPPPNPDHAYVSDGDANGVFYYLGALGNGGVWRNPHTAGDITVTASNLATGSVAVIVDRSPSDIFDDPMLSPWFKFDLGTGRAFICNYASYRQRSTGPGSNTTSFDLEGSNDNSTWTNLSTQSGISTTPDAWHSFPVSGGTAYRYFRLIRTGITDYFTIGEFELYGTLTGA